MKSDDQLFIYHSGKEKAIVGISEVTSTPSPDPTKNNPALSVINIKAVQPISRPDSLDKHRSRKVFSSHPLIRNSRLSVVPFTHLEWNLVLSLSATD